MAFAGGAVPDGKTGLEDSSTTTPDSLFFRVHDLMCGFVAIVQKHTQAVDQAELLAATRLLRHRGPDDEAYYYDGGIGFGFRRLSIIDLSQQSRQPLEDRENRFVIVFNGEIYNFVEIRDELRRKGHQFKSSGDAEVLLAAYIEWGESCLHRFNGMWSFLIYDKKNKSIFGARDRFGVKPLYVSHVDDRHIFASEIKAIQSVVRSARELNFGMVTRYLIDDALSEPNDDRETLFHNVHEVPAGHSISVTSSGTYSEKRYWTTEFLAGNPEFDPTAEFRRIFEDSVRLRMRSDVPVGVCLSGGLDSTAVICQMARLLGDNRREPLRAFSYLDENFDESREVDETVRATAAELHRLTTNSGEFLEKFHEVLWYHDEPIHSLNVLVSYELYRMAAQAGVKVILNGQGADETWGGYSSYFFNYWFGLVNQLRFRSFLSETAEFAEAHGQATSRLRRATLKTAFRNALRRSAWYRAAAAARQRRHVLKNPWFSRDLLDYYPRSFPPFEYGDLPNALERSVVRDPLPLFLRVEDRNSMAHSIETRLPFLDYRLVELAFRTAPEWKTRGKWNKFALRQATRTLIPEVVRLRVDKMGFPVSARQWFAGPLYDFARSTLGSRAARDNGLFRTDAILQDLESHRAGKIDCSAKILRAVQLQLLVERKLPDDRAQEPEMRAG